MAGADDLFGPMIEWPARPATIDDDDPASARIFRVYEACRNSITAENQLVSYRLGWMLTLTSGFIAAEAFLLGRVASTTLEKADPFTMCIGFMCLLLSGVAGWFSLWTRQSIAAAFAQILHLRRWLQRFQDDCGNIGLPPPYGIAAGFHHGRQIAVVLPFVLFGMWLFFAICELAWLAYLVIFVKAPVGAMSVVVGAAAISGALTVYLARHDGFVLEKVSGD